MRYLLLVGLVLVGCSGRGEGEIIYPNKTYSPSELIEMTSFPDEQMKVSGKVYEFDKPNNEQRWFVLIEDSAIKAVDDDKKIVIVFDSKDKEFSDSLRKWLNRLSKGDLIFVKGKPMRIPDDPKRRVYLTDPEIQ